MDLTMEEIAAACGGRLVLCEGQESDTRVTSAAVDSRKVSEGSVFFAVPGEHVDGHEFVSSAFEKGAALTIVEKEPGTVPQKTGKAAAWGSYVLVEDTLLALKQIAEYYREKLGIKVVGITGSAGKTSTKEFIASVLGEKYSVLKTEGNFNNEIGVPLTLLRMERSHQVAVVEMGISDFGEMHRLSRMAKPDICVITNIGQSHLDHLKSRDGILKAKSEIFDFMAPDGEVCLNGEDDKLASIREIKGHRPHFFGFGGSPGQEVSADHIEGKGLWGSDAVLKMKGVSFQVHVPLPGIHMVLNAAAAACVGELLGLTIEQIAAGIEKTAPVSGRDNLIPLKRYTLIDDCYNANPASMQAALDLLDMADTEKTAILGDMFGLGEEREDELHRQVGRYAAEKGIGRILCAGGRCIHLFQAASEHALAGQQIFYFPTLKELLDALEKEREKYVPDGCTALIKASHAMEFEKVLALLRRE